MSSKSPFPPMVMNVDDLALRKRLLVKWGFQCIVCGREFRDLACVSKEHLIPKSMVRGLRDNLAPSHWRCNQVRGSGSILAASREVDHREACMRPCDFTAWLNAKIPSRTVLPEALLPVRGTLWMMRCLELPEHLPGMCCT